MQDDDHSWLAWVVIAGLVVWGASSIFDDDKTAKSSTSSYRAGSAYEADEREDYVDGYIWAEDNDPTTFAECQDQFGTSVAEDDCNEYVRDNYSGGGTFKGYECTEDCSGHEAGYRWAEDNGIYDEYDCDGNSNSFNEGCLSYIEENY